jgi:hypothetical protein
VILAKQISSYLSGYQKVRENFGSAILEELLGKTVFYYFHRYLLCNHCYSEDNILDCSYRHNDPINKNEQNLNNDRIDKIQIKSNDNDFGIKTTISAVICCFHHKNHISHPYQNH